MSLITKSHDYEYVIKSNTWKFNKAEKLCSSLGQDPVSWRISSGGYWYITCKQETPEHKVFYRRFALTLIL